MAVVDVTHRVELTDEGFCCLDCGTEIPVAVGPLADEVVSLGGANVHWLPIFVHDDRRLSCTKTENLKVDAIVQCVCAGEGCEECSGEGVVAADGSNVEVAEAEVAGERKPAQPLTDMEKMVNRAGVMNFQAMRDATRPDGMR